MKCLNCKAMCAGETSRKLHERFTEHRSNIKTKKSSPVAKQENTEHIHGPSRKSSYPCPSAKRTILDQKTKNNCPI